MRSEDYSVSEKLTVNITGFPQPWKSWECQCLQKTKQNMEINKNLKILIFCS